MANQKLISITIGLLFVFIAIAIQICSYGILNETFNIPFKEFNNYQVSFQTLYIVIAYLIGYIIADN